MSLPSIIAHRGASGVERENSRAAFAAARRLGADGVELDVHATRDGALVVHHDTVIPGVGAIPELAAAACTAARLPNGEPVPLLDEVLDLLGELDVWVEVKTLAPEADAALLRVLDAGPAPARYAVHSFDHRIVRRLGERRPSLRRGCLLSSYLLDPVAPLAETGAVTLWQEHPLIDEPLVEQVHAAGATIIAWTVGAAADARRLARLGVDGLCGNHPDRLRAALQS
jgi:glycerophosphoryl diester phosphodiesterase